MYHGKFRGRAQGGGGRDHHSVHPVHLTLQASATPVVDRGIRQVTPDRLTRDQAATFRPSDLPIGQGHRRSSAASEGGSTHSSGPLRTIGFGPPALTHTMSETRMLGSKRNVVSPSKVYATELTQLSIGDSFRRHNSTVATDSEVIHQQYQEASPRNFAKLQNQQQKTSPFLPGDRVIFAESPSAPGIPIVYRTMEERAANPDRLNLDRRHLTVCPILEGEEHLRLLNFQHNSITRIQHISNLRRLIFLDLYDNQIEDMTGLSALKSLRVLMLGKNRIQRVTGLESLVKLDVLDLHGNQITTIESLNHLTELRVLNLAGNQIEHVSNLSGMNTLAELNLRRNSVRTIIDVETLTSLQRLFLSFNNIQRWEDIECLSYSSSLCEISLDGNPIAADVCYKQIVIKSMPQLRQLDMKRITDDEKRIATVMLRKEEERKREVHKQRLSLLRRHGKVTVLCDDCEYAEESGTAIAKEKKRLAISNAARQWEAEFGSPVSAQLWNSDAKKQADPTWTLTGQANQWSDYGSDKKGLHSNSTSGRSSPITDRSDTGRTMPALVEKKLTVDRTTFMTSSRTNKATIPPLTSLDISDSYLAEINGENLQLFGPGALDSIDKNWGNQASFAVTTVTVQFINFDEFSSYIAKLSMRFPNAANFVFKEVNLNSLQQLNALSNLKKLHSLTIECGPGNPVTQFALWKPYVLFRLSHFSLKKLNGEEVTSADIVNAEKIFGSLSLITTSQLSQFRLMSLVGETRQKALSNAKELKKNKQGNDSELGESVGRAGLQYTPPKASEKKNADNELRISVARELVSKLSQEASKIAEKRARLLDHWPNIFVEMVKDAVVEMWDMEAYVKRQQKLFDES